MKVNTGSNIPQSERAETQELETNIKNDNIRFTQLENQCIEDKVSEDMRIYEWKL